MSRSKDNEDAQIRELQAMQRQLEQTQRYFEAELRALEIELRETRETLRQELETKLNEAKNTLRAKEWKLCNSLLNVYVGGRIDDRRVIEAQNEVERCQNEVQLLTMSRNSLY